MWAFPPQSFEFPVCREAGYGKLRSVKGFSLIRELGWNWGPELFEISMCVSPDLQHVCEKETLAFTFSSDLHNYFCQEFVFLWIKHTHTDVGRQQKPIFQGHFFKSRITNSSNLGCADGEQRLSRLPRRPAAVCEAGAGRIPLERHAGVDGRQMLLPCRCP